VLPLDATSFENGYRTREEVVCFAVGEESVTPVYSASVVYILIIITIILTF
jgi:hypothetical protein